MSKVGGPGPTPMVATPLVLSLTDGDFTLTLYSSCLSMSSQVRGYSGAQGGALTPSVKPAPSDKLRRHQGRGAALRASPHPPLPLRRTHTLPLMLWWRKPRSLLWRSTHTWRWRRKRRRGSLKARRQSRAGDSCVLQPSSECYQPKRGVLML